MKSGLMAGVIAGVVAGIVSNAAIFALAPSGLISPSPFNPPMEQWVSAQFLLNVFWGAIFGWVFVKVYDLVPGTGIMKGLYFSLIMWIFVNIYIYSFFVFSMAYPIHTLVGLGLVGLVVSHRTDQRDSDISPPLNNFYQC